MKLRNLALSLTILASAGLVLAAYAQKSGGGHPSGKFTKGERGEDDAQIIRARASWFYRQRAYPLPRIPAFARERAWNAMRQMRQSQHLFLQQKYGADYKQLAAAAALAANVVNTTASWTSIGPQPTNEYFFQPYVSGRVSAMVVDPCDSTGNTVFLAGAQGGLWLTTNGTASPSTVAWTPLTDDAPSLAVGSLAVPPSTPGSAGCVGTVSKTVYVGTGEQNFAGDSHYGAGVLTCTTSNGSSYSCTPDQTLGAFNSQSNPLDFDAGGPYIGGLAVDPQNPTIMLAAVSGFYSTLRSGIYCSSNSGSTWTHVLPAQNILNVDGTAVAFDQAGFGYAALGTIDGSGSLNGVFKSSAALTTACSPGFSALGGFNNAAGAPSALGRIAISVSSSSTTSSSSDEIFAAVANASDVSSTLLGVFKSTNGGSTWAQPSTAALVTKSGGFCNDQCFYDLTITIDPHNPGVVYAGGAAPGNGATLIATTDGGSNWTDVSSNSCSTCLAGLHVDTHAIAFKSDGSLLYVGTDGGAWKTTSPESPSASQSWTNLNRTLALTQVYSGMSNNPAGWQYRTFLGAQDNGTQVFGQQSTPGNPLAWDDTLTCGDGGVTLVDPLIPSTMYAECAYIPNVIGAIVKSTLNGSASDSNASPSSTFFESDSGIDFTQPGNFIPPMAIDPESTGSTGDAQTLYFGTNLVWQTNDGGSSWNSISPDVTGGGTGAPYNSFCSANPGFCVLTALGVAPTSSNEVVTGSDIGEVYLSLNASQGPSSTWTDVTSGTCTNCQSLPQSEVTHVAVDPNNANLIYAVYSGFSGTYSTTQGNITIPPGHVFAGIVTPGATPSVVWSDVSTGAACASPAGNLPNIPVNDVIVDPDHPGQLFVGTDVGVFMGTLQGTAPAYTGACWQVLGSGLPNSAVLSLTLNDASRTLIAGTHGRSVWAYSLGDAPAFSLGGLSPASADAGASSALTLVLDGQGFTASSTVNWTPSGGSTTSLTQTSPPSGCAAPTCIAVSVPTTQLASGAVVQVSVSDPSQTSATNSLPFTVTSAAPTVTQISPVSGPANTSLSLSLTGTGFASKATVGLQTELGIFPCNPLAVSSGATSTQIAATVPASCLQYGGIFFVTAINPAPGGGSSNPGLLAAPAPYGTACAGMSTPGCLLTVTGSTPANDNFSNATAIGSGTFSATEDTSGATTASTDPALPPTCTSSAANGGDAKSVWFKYTPTTAVTAEADTIGSTYDTILSVWDPPSGSAAVPPTAAPLAQPPVGLILAFALGVFLLGFAFRRRRPFSRRFAAALALALLAGSLAFQGACGGGSSGGVTPPPPPPTTGLTNVACNDDVVSGVTRVSQVSNLPLVANTTYYFMVTTWGLPVYNSSGSLSGTLADGGKLVFNLNAK